MLSHAHLHLHLLFVCECGGDSNSPVYYWIFTIAMWVWMCLCPHHITKTTPPAPSPLHLAALVASCWLAGFQLPSAHLACGRGGDKEERLISLGSRFWTCGATLLNLWQARKAALMILLRHRNMTWRYESTSRPCVHTDKIASWMQTAFSLRVRKTCRWYRPTWTTQRKSAA